MDFGLADNYCCLCEALLTTPPYSRHAAALAANPHLQQAVVGFLLQRCLPALAGQAAADADQLVQHFAKSFIGLQALAAVLAVPSLSAAVARHQPRLDTVVWVQHAAANVEALPASRPDGVAAGVFGRAFEAVILLLSCLCDAMLDQPTAGSSSSGGTNNSCEQAAWELVRVVPHAAACSQALAVDGECPRSTVAAVCCNLGFALRLLERLRMSKATPAQLEAWAAAAEAGVRLQPLLARLHSEAAEAGLRLQPLQAQLHSEAAEEQQQQQQQQQQQLFAALSLQLINNLWCGMPDTRGTEPDGAAALGRRLWQLHSASCQLLHWLAADSGRCLAAFSTMGAREWQVLSHALDIRFGAACNLLRLDPGSSPVGEECR
jgi:hypothetical protein